MLNGKENIDSSPEFLARLSSMTRSKITFALTKVSFIETSSAALMSVKQIRVQKDRIPFFWLYRSINLTIFGRRLILVL